MIGLATRGLFSVDNSAIISLLTAGRFNSEEAEGGGEVIIKRVVTQGHSIVTVPPTKPIIKPKPIISVIFVKEEEEKKPIIGVNLI